MIRVFLLAGQSNMVGAGVTAQIPAAQRRFPQNVRLFEAGAWRDLLWGDRFGPEVGFANEIGRALPDDLIALCKVAGSGANICYDWNPDGVSRGAEDVYRGPLYPKLFAEFNSLKSLLKGQGEPVDVSAMLWMQGERDSVFQSMAEFYAVNLAAFIARIRLDLGDSTLPFLLAEIAPRVYLPEEQRLQHAFRDVVQKAQREVASADPWAKLVQTLDLPQSDNLHFDTGGQLELGCRFALAYLSVAGVRE